MITFKACATLASLALQLVATAAAAFTLPIPFLSARSSPSNPALTDYAESQTSAQINLRLDIGRADDTSRLPVDNLLLELGRPAAAEKSGDSTSTTPLPGADGPNPGLSSGRQTLSVLNSGTYVTLSGTQSLPLQSPAWEIVWRYSAPAGSIVFGFQVPEEVKRNDATLPPGRMYVSFPVWTMEGLKEARRHITEVERLAHKYEGERDDALEQANATPNPLMKALHFREAFAAQERLDFSGIRSLGSVPGEQDMVPLIGGELFVVKQGLVWTKQGNFFGGQHSLLGHSTVAGVTLGGGVAEGGKMGGLRP